MQCVVSQRSHFLNALHFPLWPPRQSPWVGLDSRVSSIVHSWGLEMNGIHSLLYHKHCKLSAEKHATSGKNNQYLL